MADRSIPFTAPMVRALLAGTKTQTRRTNGLPQIKHLPSGLWHVFNKHGGVIGIAEDQVGATAADYTRYSVGDRLYVREHWRVAKQHDPKPPRDLIPRTMTVFFEAGGSIANEDVPDDWQPSDWPKVGEMPNWVGRFRHGMFMPRWASRLTLLVTDVRVQRLKDISREDAVAEGLIRSPYAPPVAQEMGCDWGFEGDHRHGSPISAYATLWDHINGKGAWASNPFVAAYSFTVSLGNIDTLKEAHHG